MSLSTVCLLIEGVKGVISPHSKREGTRMQMISKNGSLLEVWVLFSCTTLFQFSCMFMFPYVSYHSCCCGHAIINHPPKSKERYPFDEAPNGGSLSHRGTPSHHPFRTMGFSLTKSIHDMLVETIEILWMGQRNPNHQLKTIDRWFIPQLFISFLKKSFIAGWCFGCHQCYFPLKIGNVIIPIDELIFFRGVQPNHQPEKSFIEISRGTMTLESPNWFRFFICAAHCGSARRKTVTASPHEDQWGELLAVKTWRNLRNPWSTGGFFHGTLIESRKWGWKFCWFFGRSIDFFLEVLNWRFEMEISRNGNSSNIWRLKRFNNG